MTISAEHHDTIQTLIEDMVAQEVVKGPVSFPDIKLRIFEKLRLASDPIMQKYLMAQCDPEQDGVYEWDVDMKIVPRVNSM